MIDLDQVRAEALNSIAAAADLEALEGLLVSLLGKKGSISLLMKSLGEMGPEERKTAGQQLNAVKDAAAAALEERKTVLEASALVDLAELEHATARQIIRQMQIADPREARYEALVMALTECVERHARHEQAQLFPRLRESCLDMGALGQQLNERLSEHDDRAFVAAAAH